LKFNREIIIMLITNSGEFKEGGAKEANALSGKFLGVAKYTNFYH
jgi:hypothetical protein